MLSKPVRENSRKSKDSDTRNASYEVFKRDFGIDIPTQSRQNLARLQTLCRERDVGCNDLGLTALEARFKEYWDNTIAPLFIAVHRTDTLKSIMQDGHLRSVTSRVVDNNKLGTAHPSGRESLNRQVYFTFGLPGHLEQQHLYNSSCDRVIVHAGKAVRQEDNPLPGLWVNNHIFEYGRNTTTKGIRFGEYSRYLQYESTGRQKHYVYYRGDERIYSRTVSYGDEIFSAEEGMHHITDGMFYLFILDLYHLGADAQALLVEPSVEKIIRCFNSLFPASETLEAKYVYKLELNNPLVECITSTMTERLALADFHYAVYHSDILSIKKHLERNPEFIYMKDTKGQTALYTVVSRWSSSKKNEELIGYLLSAGADIGQDDGFGDILEQSLIKRTDLAFQLLHGIPDNLIPTMSHFIAVTKDRHNHYSHCHHALKQGNNDIVQIILDRISAFDPTDPVIHVAVEAARSQNPRNSEAYSSELNRMLPILLAKGARIDALRNRKTALMTCAERGDVVGIRTLVARGADINLGKSAHNSFTQNGPITIYADSGTTALHLAAAAQHKAAVELLLELGANPTATNAKGLNAAQYVNLEKSKLRKTIADQNEGLWTILFEPEAYQNFEDEQFAKQSQQLDEIIAFLSPLVGAYELTEAPEYYQRNQRVINTVAMITVTHYDDKDYVLVVQKRNAQHRLTGHLLFPGGFLDGLEDDIMLTAQREVAEETCLQFDVEVQIFKQLQHENRTHTFCLQRLTVDPSQHVPAPASDVGLARWVAINEIECEVVEGFQVARFEGSRLRHSNILCLQQLGYISAEPERDLLTQWKFEEYGGPEVVKAYESDQTEIARCIHRGFDVTQLGLLKKVIYDNNQDELERLVSLGLDVNQLISYSFFYTIPLTCLVVMLGHFQLAKHMVNHLNADISVTGTFSVLGEAIRSQDDDFIAWCLQATPDNAETALGIALLICILADDNQHFTQLLDKEIDLNKEYPIFTDGYSLMSSAQPLVLAAQFHRFDMMTALIQSGAKVSLMTIHTHGPIFLFNHELEMAKLQEQKRDDDDGARIHNTKTRLMMSMMTAFNSAERIQKVLDILEPAAKEEGHHYRSLSFS